MEHVNHRKIPNSMMVERPYAARLAEQLLFYAMTYVERYGLSVVPGGRASCQR